MWDIGVNPLFSFYIDGDAVNNPDFMVPWISQAGLTLPTKEHYLNEELVQVYCEVVADILDDPEQIVPPRVISST